MSLPAKSTVFWLESVRRPRYPRLQGNVKADVAIVGGGIVGLTTAELLRRRGQRVVVLEAERVGAATTGGSSAHVTEVLDIDYRDMPSRLGEEQARQFVRAARSGLEWIAAFVGSQEIECDFQRVSGFRYAESAEDAKQLQDELEVATQLGVACRAARQVPLPFATRYAIEFPHQAQFHPMKYVRGLARTFVAGGGRIFEHTRVINVQEDHGSQVETEHGTVRAKQLVLATHVPINFNLVQTEVVPLRSYILVYPLRRPGPEGLFWDTDTPYHYVRSHSSNGENHLIIGDEDHRTGHEDDPKSRLAKLEQFAKDRFGVGSPAFHWSAQLYDPADGAPFVGRSPMATRVYIATGFSGNGLAMGTAAGMLLSDSVLGKESPWSEAFDARRVKPVAGGAVAIRKNLSDALAFVTDRITAAEAMPLSEVGRNQGRVLKVNGETLAVSRNEHGELQVLSATCTHLGCIVRWNAAERSWDCPCHGGRFAPTGEILDGPPTKRLERRPLPEKAQAPREEARR